MAGILLAPEYLVKGINAYPPFDEAIRATQDQVMSRAARAWPEVSPGGLTPTGAQYGLGPFAKQDMSNDTTDSTRSGSYSFRFNTAATGWRTTFSYTVRKDQIHGFTGFSISDDVLRILAIQLTITGRDFPIWDIQEAQAFNGPVAIVLKTDAGGEIVVDPGSTIIVRTYHESTGFQRLVPLGIQAFRRIDLVNVRT